MKAPPTRPSVRGTALVLVPAGMNYFYEQHGARLAEALRELGFEAEVGHLGAHADRDYDWCVLTNVSEIVLSYDRDPAAMSGAISPARERAALEAVSRLRGRARLVSACSIDCVSTPWYGATRRRCAASGIETVLDFGLHDQGGLLSARDRRHYRFVLNGLTGSERVAAARAGDGDDGRRVLPWSFVGHCTPDRAALVDRMVQEYDPGGFVYIPELRVIAGAGSAHLNERQYDAVLRATRYQIWCSHHPHFYMEGERFRMSLLAGSVPIKVVPGRSGIPARVPFDGLVVAAADLTDALRDFDFAAVRRRFRDDFLAAAPLSAGVADFLSAEGLLPAAARGPAVGPPALRRAS